MVQYRNHPKGFTIVELLVVIVVIGILAAITIVAYNGFQQKARESRIAAQLSQARKQMELERIENGVWPFQAGIDTRVANGNIWGNAWCNAARDWLSGNGMLSGSSGMYCLGNNVRGCLGAQVGQSWIVISSIKLGVSRAFTTYEVDETNLVSQWCSS